MCEQADVWQTQNTQKEEKSLFLYSWHLWYSLKQKKLWLSKIRWREKSHFFSADAAHGQAYSERFGAVRLPE